MNIEELKEKYPYHKIIYSPKEDCRFCKGTGENRRASGYINVCICTCVDHSFAEIAQDSLNKIAREELGE